MDAEPKPSDAHEFLSGGGEMGERIRAFDWAQTPLGGMGSWPQGLKTAASIMLNSRYPMFVWWGDELTILYNDGYAPIFAKKHPTALGQPARRVWAEIWKDLAAQVDGVMREGRASWNEEVLLFMERNGFPEEVYFTWSYSPVLDDNGKVGGLFCACTEETARVLARRRLKTLRDLGERSLEQGKTVEQACHAAAVTLAENPKDFPCALIYLLDDSGRCARLSDTVNFSRGIDARLITVPIGDREDFWNFRSILQTNESRVVENLEEQLGGPAPGAWDRDSTTRALIVPLARSGTKGSVAGFLIAGISSRLNFDDEYQGVIELAARQLATAIGNARAYEEEQRRAQALAEIDRAKTVFFSNVSHEFRTPLTLILGPTEELLAGSAGATNEIQRAHLTALRNNALRLQKLVNTMLDFARVEAGRAEATYEPVDLGLLTRDLASTFCSAIHRAGLLYIMNCPSMDEPVYVDRDMWEKIVLNLLSNALKFTFSGVIEISLRNHNTSIELVVRDTGAGIPQEELPRLFDRFHRVRATQARTHEGSGIGLALVQELVRLHGGRIEVESEIGKGSTFKVFLAKGNAHLPKERLSAPRALSSTALGSAPFVQEALSWLSETNGELRVLSGEWQIATGESPLIARDSPRITGPRILIVDDNLEMRNYLKRLLDTRWHVSAVEDGARALEVARAERPDLVLSDAMMPRLSGFELLQKLRDDESTRTIPVILLSARAGEEAYIEGMRAGADDYIVKPFSARELIARVSALLEVTRVRRESENILRESDERFRLATRAGKVGVWDWDIRANTVTWSDTLYEIHGIERGAFGGTVDAFAAMVHPEDRAHVWSRIQRAQLENAPYQIEFRIVRPSGSVGWIYTQATVIRDSSGAPTRMVGATVDITARKRAEQSLAEALRQQEALYRFLEQRYRAESLDEVYEAALDAIVAALGCSRAAILFFDSSAKMRFVASRGLSATYCAAVDGHSPWTPHETNPQPVCVADVARADLADALKKSVLDEGIRALAFIPIILDDRLIGKFMTYYNEAHEFDRDELELSLTVGRQLALGVERKRAEDALAESEARYRAVVESQSEMLCRFRADGTIVFVNEPYAQACGTTAGALTGANFWQFITEGDRADVRAMLERLTPETPEVRIENRFDTIEGVRWTLWTNRALNFDPHGRWTEAQSTGIDISDRRRAEEALRRSEERFRAMADSSAILIWMTDNQGKTQFLNRTYLEFAGIPSAEMQSFDCRQIVHPEERAAYAEAFETALRQGRTFHQRARLRRFDGVWRWFESRANPIMDEAGNLSGSIGTSTDITEIYESQQVLRELGQRKDEFLANMSHEIRSPLTGIMGYADLLMGRLKDPEDLEFLRTIKESGDYLIEIVNDILDLSKIEAGKLVLNIEPVAVHSVLSDVQQLMAVRARQKKLSLGLRYESALPELVRTDRTRLRQILVNLVSNGIKFTEKGRVDLVARMKSGALELEVVDTGIGIAPEQQKILFHPFTQADTSSTRQYGGTGLGLTITKRLVEMLGGSISFESEQGKGSTFRVTIPAESAVAETSSKRRLPEWDIVKPTGNALQAKRVLVVDDREEICYLVSRYIREAGGRPAEVTDGESALKAIAEASATDPFDTVILDIHMPEMDGYEVVRALRDRGFTRPVIALTAGAMLGDREKCLKAGFDDYLTKPIDRRKLVELVGDLAGDARLRNGKMDGRRVLVVDDSHNACKFLTMFLEKRGYLVRSVYDGESALEAAQDFEPGVIVLDIRLPDMDGFQLMRRLKGLDRITGAKFIGLSGYRDGGELTREFDYFLEKPLDTAQLDHLLREIGG